MKLVQLIFTLFCSLLLCETYCQKQHKISAFLEGEFANTVYDKTIGNNPWGIGLGFQAFLNNNGRIHPTIELSEDAYFEDDKVLRINPNGVEIDDIRRTINLFAGASIHPSQPINISFLAGPALINSNICFAVKPSLGFYFSKKERVMGRISYVNVFNRTHDPNADFGSLNLSVSVSLFNK